MATFSLFTCIYFYTIIKILVAIILMYRIVDGFNIGIV